MFNNTEDRKIPSPLNFVFPLTSAVSFFLEMYMCNIHYFMISSTNRHAFRSSQTIPIPVSKEAVVIVTTAELLPTDAFPPNAGGVDGHPKKCRSW